MPTIYIISEGTPPNREVYAAFSTREAAEAAMYLTSTSCEVVEYPVDAPLPTGPEGHSLWAIERMQENYEVIRLNAYLYEKERTNLVQRYGNSCNVILWARDEEHAVASAKELFEPEEVLWSASPFA